MSTASIFVVLFLAFGLLFISVFKKHAILNFGCLLAWMGAAFIIEISNLQGKFWLESACVMVIIYEIIEISKMRGLVKK